MSDDNGDAVDAAPLYPYNLTRIQFNLLVVWLPATLLVMSISVLRLKLSKKLRWSQMVLRLTATHTNDTRLTNFSDRAREVLNSLLSNVTLLATLGCALALSLLTAPTELMQGDDAGTVLGQYFIFFSFASTGTYMFATISSSLTLLYLEQFNDQQLHALLCERAAELFVEPLLAFISATLYLLVSGVLFCVYVYGAEAGIGLSVVVTVPILKIYKACEDPDAMGGDSPRGGQRRSILKKSLTVVGQSKLLEKMKDQEETVRARKEARKEARRKSGSGSSRRLSSMLSFRFNAAGSSPPPVMQARSTRSRTILPASPARPHPSEGEGSSPSDATAQPLPALPACERPAHGAAQLPQLPALVPGASAHETAVEDIPSSLPSLASTPRLGTN